MFGTFGPPTRWPSVCCDGEAMTLLEVRLGDLTTARADAIATSADVNLKAGGGVNGAIPAAAGPELARHCARLGGCSVGDAETTPAGRLHARYVIHGVAP